MSNLNNLAKSSTDSSNKIAIAKKPTAYVPVKEKIHFIEKDQKPENDEFLMKHKFIAKKLIENNEDEKCAEKDDDHHEEKNGNGNDIDHNSNGNGTHSNDDIVPPKPLPRKSLSEQGSFELDCNGVPRPKPRMAATGYKVQRNFYTHIFLSVFC